MKLTSSSPDPLKILSSTKAVVDNLKHVSILDDGLVNIAKSVDERLESGLETEELSFGSTGDFEDDIQLVFLQDVVNFCFWAEKDKPRWQVVYPAGDEPTDGWYSLVGCFQRALESDIPILDAGFLSSITLQQSKAIFRGENEIDIPLVEKRWESLQEAGRVLSGKFDGKAINILKESGYDAVDIAKIIYKNFNSFKDVSTFEDKEIFFLKRAQICPKDFAYVVQHYGKGSIASLDRLTAFADYKLPQILRKYGAIKYSEDLAHTVDNCELIPSNSREEIEIRSATIWCVELIKQELKKYTAADIDNALWLLSQDRTDIKPYHRTYSIFY